MSDAQVADVREPDVAAENVENTAENDAPGVTADKPKRQMSTVEFPYYSLESCLEIAQRLHANRGQSAATPDQVAAWLGSVVTSGTYKLRISAARMFGLIATERGSVRLTDLGARTLDPEAAGPAKVEAFLNVELYRKVYEANRGRLLPKAAGLQAEMVGLGVSPNQAEKARQVFDRAAREAGFFEHGADRLVQPSFNGAPPSSMIHEAQDDAPEPAKRAAPERKTEAHAVADDPLVQGLLNRMPSPDKGWPVAERARWLQAFAMNLSLIYGDQGEVKITPTLDTPAGSAQA